MYTSRKHDKSKENTCIHALNVGFSNKHLILEPKVTTNYYQNSKYKKKGAAPAKEPQCAYNYAVWYLNKYGEQSERTLREKIRKAKTNNEEWIDFAISKLQEYGFQSDARYADMIIRKGLSPSSSWGVRRIQQEMIKKGISRDIAEEALGALNEDNQTERATQALEKKYKTLVIKDQKERSRAVRFLSGKGFGFDVISSAISAHNERLAE